MDTLDAKVNKLAMNHKTFTELNREMNTKHFDHHLPTESHEEYL